MKKILFSFLFLSISLNAESIKIAIDPTYPPFEYKDTNGQIVGFDIDLLAAIAPKAGFNYTLVNTSHDSACNAVNNKSVDMAISAFTIDKFTQNCDSSDSYYNPRFIFLKISGSNITSIDDLSGKKIGFIGNDTAKEMIENLGAKPIKRDRSALVNLFIAMQEGKADALLIDSRSLPILTNNYEHMGQADKDKLETYERMGFGRSLEIFYQEEIGSTETFILFPSDGSKNDLKTRINNAIAELKSNGTIDSLIKKYHL
ncbi:MAG: transporter substrate-binding domain-containing protein [Campylobacter sp.]|nr:transporter substrate-binding domain-containing protein [Campylobacter sp.]